MTGRRAPPRGSRCRRCCAASRPRRAQRCPPDRPARCGSPAPCRRACRCCGGTRRCAVRGWRCGVALAVIIVGKVDGGAAFEHGGILSFGIRPRPSRPSRRSLGRKRRRVAPAGPKRQRRMAGTRAFCFAMQSRPSGWRRKMVGDRHCKPAQGGLAPSTIMTCAGRPAFPADRRCEGRRRGPFPE